MKPFYPALLWAAVILFLSTKGGVQLPDIGLSTDKLAHFSAYALLGWLLLRGLEKTGKWNWKTAAFWLTVAAAYGALLEVVQWQFFPDRFFEYWDMAANALGAAASYPARRFWLRRQ